MEEKIIIESENYNVNAATKTILIIGAVVSALWIMAMKSDFPLLEGIVIFIFFALIALSVHLLFAGHKLTVTDKRVYGKTRFGKRIDLPIEKVSSVMVCAFKGVGIATSSGRILFLFCKNQELLFHEISQLLLTLKHHTQTTVIKQESQSNADELKKFKDLLDSGVITQEEFDAKKKQLLGL